MAYRDLERRKQTTRKRVARWRANKNVTPDVTPSPPTGNPVTPIRHSNGNGFETIEIPEKERWLYENPEALESVQQGLAEAADGKVSEIDIINLHTGEQETETVALQMDSRLKRANAKSPKWNYLVKGEK